jgi:hypothetical protein
MVIKMMIRIGIDRRFTGVYCLHHQDALMIEAGHTSETSVYSNETTWHYIPEGCNLDVTYSISRNKFSHCVSSRFYQIFCNCVIFLFLY